MLHTALDSPPETSLAYRGWRVVLVCFVMATFCWGFGFYGQSVFLADLSRLHGWPASLVSTAITAYYLISALLVAFVSDIMGRLGPKLMVLGGIACLGGATAALALITTPWELFAAFFLMAFGWAAMSLGAISNILGLWFNHRRGLAISLALNGASCGGILVAPALAFLVSAVGFANAVWIAVATMICVLTPLAVLWIDRPAYRPEGGGTIPSAEVAEKTPDDGGWTKARALRSAHFWGVTATFALALVVQVGFLVHQISFLEPMLGHSLAGAAVGITAIMALLGRLALGSVIDRLDQRLATALSLTSQAGAVFAVTQTTNPTVLLLACAVFGLSVGNVITLPSLIIQREFEARSFGLLVGLSTAICQIIYAAGPGLLGLLRDMTGSYVVPFLICAALDLFGAAIIVAGRPKG
jgi:MFS family permease